MVLYLRVPIPTSATLPEVESPPPAIVDALLPRHPRPIRRGTPSSATEVSSFGLQILAIHFWFAPRIGPTLDEFLLAGDAKHPEQIPAY